ncbi:hypothetical protein BDY19DRAFT_910300 [Irpex rosettiformis]|uniref:Uncharacterized protein n=1 Tax=Irpex rosettiformis TaxID=378272 RepID=A0ACB8TP83_9APHY|nr:hypothetical protein BDY19DRAFT_910300 [Irpex rosettiformis]
MRSSLVVSCVTTRGGLEGDADNQTNVSYTTQWHVFLESPISVVTLQGTGTGEAHRFFQTVCNTHLSMSYQRASVNDFKATHNSGFLMRHTQHHNEHAENINLAITNVNSIIHETLDPCPRVYRGDGSRGAEHIRSAHGGNGKLLFKLLRPSERGRFRCVNRGKMREK